MCSRRLKTWVRPTPIPTSFATTSFGTAKSGGEPVFKGTRVLLRTVLASLATGDSAEDVLADFPSLKPEDVRAAIAFAAASAEEDLPAPAAPDIR